MGIPQNGRFAVFSLFSATVFALPLLLHGSDARGAQLTTLHGFCAEAACADGSDAQSALVRDASGNPFGVTREVGMDLAEMGARLVLVVTDPVVAKLPPVQTVLESVPSPV